MAKCNIAKGEIVLIRDTKFYDSRVLARVVSEPKQRENSTSNMFYLDVEIIKGKKGDSYYQTGNIITIPNNRIIKDTLILRDNGLL